MYRNLYTGTRPVRPRRRWNQASRRGSGLLLLSLLLFSVHASPTTAVPSQVVLLRHAEKPADKDAVHLNERGRERAAALADWLTTDPTVTRVGPPAVLFAPRISRHDHSRRPFETLEPVARKLNLTIQMPVPAADYKALAQQILTSPECDGKTVVVCWTHEYLPELAKALGVRPEPPPWKGHVFDRAWVIRWPKHKAKMTEIAQRLLPGDSTK